jgi:hypothetical protein
MRSARAVDRDGQRDRDDRSPGGDRPGNEPTSDKERRLGDGPATRIDSGPGGRPPRTGLRLAKVVLVGPAGPDPLLDLIGEPHLALLQDRCRFREVGARGELIDALAADAAEADADLMGAHQPGHPFLHVTIGTRRLWSIDKTSGGRDDGPARLGFVGLTS